jgi:hypothetical protein
MHKVIRNKYFLIALIYVSISLIIWQVVAKFFFIRDIALWQALVMFLADNVPGSIGLLSLLFAWGALTVKEVDKK